VDTVGGRAERVEQQEKNLGCASDHNLFVWPRRSYVASCTGQSSPGAVPGGAHAAGDRRAADPAVQRDEAQTKYVPAMKGKTVDLSKTYTNEFATKANAG